MRSAIRALRSWTRSIAAGRTCPIDNEQFRRQPRMVSSIPLALRVSCSTALLTFLLFEPILTGARADLGSRVDAIMAPFTSDGPGASVVVVKDRGVLVRRAYGLANLETRTPMRPEMVFELGSVTKQFTSTAILMLAQQGKL